MQATGAIEPDQALEAESSDDVKQRPNPPAFLLLCLLCLCHQPVQADALRLVDVERLLPANREIKAAERAIEGARAGVVVAAQAPNPTISYAALSINPRNGLGIGTTHDKRTDQIVALSQLVERGDKRTLRRETAEALVGAALSDGADVRRQQRLAVHHAYFELSAAQERKRLLDDTLRLYRGSQAAMVARQAAGDVAAVDASRVRVEAARAENDARAAATELSRARRTLAYLIGRDGEDVEAVDRWPEVTPVALELADPERRPDVRAARARFAAADRARDLARSLQTRDVTVGGQIERHEPDPGVTFGITLSIPLFTNYYYEGEVARAESDVEAARESLDKTAALARTEMARAVTELTAAIDRLRRLDDEVLPEARGVAEAAEFAYAKGAIGLTDLLDARRTLRAVELDSVNARLDHAKARSAWLAASEWEGVAP